jgi:hypothetical protein
MSVIESSPHFDIEEFARTLEITLATNDQDIFIGGFETIYDQILQMPPLDYPGVVEELQYFLDRRRLVLELFNPSKIEKLRAQLQHFKVQKGNLIKDLEFRLRILELYGLSMES